MTPNEILSQALVGRLIQDEYARKSRTLRIIGVKICGEHSNHSDWAEGYVELTVLIPNQQSTRRLTRTYWPNETIPFVEVPQ